MAECEPGVRHRIADGIPILIDFSRSIVPEAGTYRSLVPRGRWNSWLKRVINGRSDVTARNCDSFLSRVKKLNPAPTVLVIGGGTVGDGAERLYQDSSLRVIAFDVYVSDGTTMVADAHNVPLVDACVDAVWIQAVLEHVLEPQVVVGEIWRVLKEGGLVYSETPFMQMVHEGAFDFSRFTELGHRYQFRAFDVIDSGPVAGPGTVLRWALRYAVAGLFRSRAAGTAVWVLTFWLRFLDRLVSRTFASDGASCLYFLGEKSANLLAPRDVVNEYRGAQG